MKLRLRQEDYLQDRDNGCMKRFKQNTTFDNAELTEGVFHKTETKKKTVKVVCDRAEYYFEEWEPGAFEKTFEVL